jgi:hypothetical protein
LLEQEHFSFPNDSSTDRFPLLDLTILDEPSTVDTLLSQSTFGSITLHDTNLLPVETLSSEFSFDSEIVSSALHAANNDGYLFNDVHKPNVSSNSDSQQ